MEAAASNCYAPPASSLTFDAFEPEPAAVGPVAQRLRTLRAESQIIGLGQLYLGIGLVGWSLGAGLVLAAGFEPEVGLMFWILGFALRALGALQIVAGVALWARVPAARFLGQLVALPVLCSFPLGTVLGISTLRVLSGRDAAEVLSEGHLALRRLSPAVRVPRSAGSWLAIALCPLVALYLVVNGFAIALDTALAGVF